jgi:hypothetical protein
VSTLDRRSMPPRTGDLYSPREPEEGGWGNVYCAPDLDSGRTYCQRFTRSSLPRITLLRPSSSLFHPTSQVDSLHLGDIRSINHVLLIAHTPTCPRFKMGGGSRLSTAHESIECAQQIASANARSTHLRPLVHQSYIASLSSEGKRHINERIDERMSKHASDIERPLSFIQRGNEPHRPSTCGRPGASNAYSRTSVDL